MHSASPNKGGALRPKGCVLHATHGRGKTLEAEFQGTLSWFANPASQVSAHVVIAADGTLAIVVPANVKAWHAKAFNTTFLGIEFCKRDPSLYADVLTEAQYKTAAWWLVERSREYGFTLSDHTLPQHRDIQSDKIDIGEGFDRAVLMDWIKAFQEVPG